MKKKVVVVGAGKTGIATSNFLANLGMEVILNDKNKIPEKLPLNRKVKIVDEGHPENVFKEAEIIVVSPGIDIKKLPVKDKSKIVGDIELFSWFDESKVVSITGTNGKTTTTYLTGEILKKKYNVFVGGNIGTPSLMRFQPFQEYDFSVLELSSFQLETIDKFYADIVAILNITPDHLDRYSNFEEYVAAKMNILKNQKKSQVVILNSDYPMLKNLETIGKKILFNKRDIIKDDTLNVEYENVNLYLDINKIKLKGTHFYEDIYVAALIGILNNIPEEEIKDVVYNFKGLEHRLEFICEKNGIKYFNDSKSTTVSSTCRAVETFKENIILLLGGIYKGESFDKLLQFKNIKKIICFGEAKEIISQQLESIEPITVDTLDEAVFKAEKIADNGDVILFSPACSSFDMFKNYIERGEAFKELINS
jgi:UDP-N-acetylmuramoylalanine--D-glutamate ligase